MLVVNSNRRRANSKTFNLDPLPRGLTIPPSITNREVLRQAAGFMIGTSRSIYIDARDTDLNNRFVWVDNVYSDLLIAVDIGHPRNVGIIRMVDSIRSLVAMMMTLSPHNRMSREGWESLPYIGSESIDFSRSEKTAIQLLADLEAINEINRPPPRKVSVKEYMQGSNFETISFPLQFQYAQLEKLND